jgi:ribosomal protein S18 acetylase RimI-like enzyme
MTVSGGACAGVATQLFTQVINSARIARAARIFLHVLEGNQAALSFYKKQVLH